MTQTPSEMHPDPPIPAFVDLRHYRDMPLEVQTLLDSTIAGIGDAEIFRCAILLWCKSWQQVPCGALEDDDGTLARACGLGRDLKTWTKIKAHALRGFRKANDGRLYHWMVCTKAAEGWNSSALWQWNKACDAQRKVNKVRKDQGLDPLPMPEKPAKISCGWGKDGPLLTGGSEPPTPANSGGNTPPAPTNSTGVSDGIPAENAGKEIEGKGIEVEGNPKGSTGAGAPAAPAASPQVQSPIPANTRRPTDLLGDEDDGLDPPLAIDRSPEAHAVRTWNDTATRVNTDLDRTEWPLVQKLTAARRKAIRGRLKDCGGIDGWTDALDKAARDPWLRGETPRSPQHENWRFNLDTLVREQFFTKLMEAPDDGTPSRRRNPGEERGLSAALAGILAETSS